MGAAASVGTEESPEPGQTSTHTGGTGARMESRVLGPPCDARGGASDHGGRAVPFDFCFHAGKHCGLQENQHEISNTGAVCLAP